MPKFLLRSWMEQTLSDSEDYEVEADTIEEAAERLADLQAQADGTDGGHIETDAGVRRLRSFVLFGDDGERTVCHAVTALDPAEITHTTGGIADINGGLRDLVVDDGQSEP